MPTAREGQRSSFQRGQGRAWGPEVQVGPQALGASLGPCCPALHGCVDPDETSVRGVVPGPLVSSATLTNLL